MNGPDDKPAPAPEDASSPPPQATEPDALPLPLQSWEARSWRALGTVSVAIGVINAFIPLLPTTVFLLIGAWAYGKGDPRLRQRLLAHPTFGPSLRRWVEHRQISTRGKVAACTGIAASMAITAWILGSTPVTWMVDAGLAGLILYLITRPGVRPPAGERPSTI